MKNLSEDTTHMLICRTCHAVKIVRGKGVRKFIERLKDHVEKTGHNGEIIARDINAEPQQSSNNSLMKES